MRTVTIEKDGNNYTVNPNATSPKGTTAYIWNLSDNNGSAILPVDNFDDITVGMKGYIATSSTENIEPAEITSKDSSEAVLECGYSSINITSEMTVTELSFE